MLPATDRRGNCMDKSTTPGGAGSTNPPWPEDSGSEGSFGATGVFGTIGPGAQAEKPAAGPDPDGERAKSAPSAAAKPQPVLGVKPLQEPVVHKVVFGSGGEESPAQLLERIRALSAERPSIVDKPAATAPAPAAGGKGSGGFTELLRSIGGDASAPAPAARPVAPPVARPAAPVSGFTSLLQSLNVPEMKVPAKPVQATQAEPARPAPAPTPGSFTELLRVTELATPEPASAQAAARGLGDAARSGPSAVQPGSKPGTFTQLFSAFGDAETSAPPPVTREPEGAYSGGGAHSFTRMLSLEQESSTPSPAFREERTESAGDRDYGFSPATVDRGRTDAATPSRDPFAQTLPEAQPAAESVPQASGVGITRLIQMLDEPATMAAPPALVPPASPATGEGPGVWTRTFASLDSSSAAAPAAVNPPSWGTPPMGGVPAAMNEFAPAASRPTGPSEFTRILDASRLREEAMRGGQAAGESPAAVQGLAAPRPAVPMPGFPAAAPPPAPGMKPVPPVPQAGGFAPQPAPPYPMNFAAPVPPASLPSAPPVPQPPAVKAPQAGVGKLQAYVPLLLVMIIVLLVVLLVTVIFLMKH